MPSFLDRQIFRPTGSVDARPEEPWARLRGGLPHRCRRSTAPCLVLPRRVGRDAGLLPRQRGRHQPPARHDSRIAGGPGRINLALRLPRLWAQRGRALRARGLPRLPGRRRVGSAAGGNARGGLLWALPRGRRRHRDGAARTTGRPDHRGRLPLGSRDGRRVAPIHRLGELAVAAGPVRQRGQDSPA